MGNSNSLTDQIDDSEVNAFNDFLRSPNVISSTEEDEGNWKNNFILDREKLKCGECNNYLSQSPIHNTSEGKSICHDCASKSGNGNFYRQFLLENLLETVRFPCRFHAEGCARYFLFNEGSTHEDCCPFRTFDCPSVPCNWKGTTNNIFEHYSQKHNDLIRTYSLLEYEDQTKHILMKIDNVVFIFQYSYKSDSKHFTYGVSRITQDAEASFNLKLHMVQTGKRSQEVINLDGYPCFLFNVQHPRDIQSSKTVKLGSYQILSSTADLGIEVVIKVKTGPSSGPKKLLEDRPDVLKKLKCSGCFWYMVPPIYTHNDLNICSSCNTNIKAIRNHKLESLCTTMYYPCRWLNCNFKSSVEVIRLHELSCDYRVYKCFSKSCTKECFKQKDLIEHYEKSHQVVYAKNHEVIGLVETSNVYLTFYRNVPIVVEYTNSKDSTWKIFGSQLLKYTIYFKHNNCKIELRDYNIKDGIYVLDAETKARYKPCSNNCKYEFCIRISM